MQTDGRFAVAADAVRWADSDVIRSKEQVRCNERILWDCNAAGCHWDRYVTGSGAVVLGLAWRGVVRSVPASRAD